MRIFLFAPESNSTIGQVRRLILRGYIAEHASPRHFAGQPSEEQMRARIMRLITWCDAVAVPDGAITPEELSRLLVVCEFAGKRIVRYEDLPGEAPAGGMLPAILAIGTRVSMLPTPDVRPDVAAMRVRHLVKRAAQFFDNGRWLKNAISAGRA